MTQEATITRNTTMDPETDAIIEQKAAELAKLTGSRPNYSAAIRAIVREWAGTQPPPRPDSRKAGKVA